MPSQICNVGLNCKTGGAYLFSRYAASVTALGFIPTPALIEARNMVEWDAPDGVPQKVEINVWGWEHQAFTEGATTVRPVPKNELFNSGVNNVNREGFFTHSSILKVRVQWETNAYGCIRDVDIAQGSRFTIFADRVSVRALAPQNVIVEPPMGNNAPTMGLGLILSSMLGVSIAPATSDTPGPIITNTFTFTQNTLADAVNRIPPGAKRLTLYQNPNGTVATGFFIQNELLVGGLRPVLGNIDIGPTRRAQDLKIPGNAQSIVITPADPLSNRFFTAVYELDL